MTRANINFLSAYESGKPEDLKILFFYWNGDQYPTGIDNHYNVRNFLDSDWSVESFNKWAKDNYEGIQPKEVDQPKIYYTQHYITDYSYVFDNSLGEKNIKVWNWTELVFDGSVEEFKAFLDKEVKQD